MPRLITAVAIVAATGTMPVLSQAQPDLRCVDTDQAMTERVRDVLARNDRRAAGTAPLNRVLGRMAAARLDCKQGRIERGLRTYADADAALRTLEDAQLPHTARSGAADATR